MKLGEVGPVVGAQRDAGLGGQVGAAAAEVTCGIDPARASETRGRAPDEVGHLGVGGPGDDEVGPVAVALASVVGDDLALADVLEPHAGGPRDLGDRLLDQHGPDRPHVLGVDPVADRSARVEPVVRPDRGPVEELVVTPVADREVRRDDADPLGRAVAVAAGCEHADAVEAVPVEPAADPELALAVGPGRPEGLPAALHLHLQHDRALAAGHLAVRAHLRARVDGRRVPHHEGPLLRCPVDGGGMGGGCLGDGEGARGQGGHQAERERAKDHAATLPHRAGRETARVRTVP